VQIRVPRNVPLVVVPETHRPRLECLLAARRPRLPVGHRRRGPGPSIGKRPRILRIPEDLSNAAVRRQPPHDVLAGGPPDHLGQSDLLIAKVQHRLSGAAQLVKLLKHALQRRLDLSIRGFLHAILVRADEAHRHLPHHTAPLHLLLEGRAGPLAKQAQFKFAHRALEAQQ
jgi:hypothetical protein